MFTDNQSLPSRAKGEVPVTVGMYRATSVCFHRVPRPLKRRAQTRRSGSDCDRTGLSWANRFECCSLHQPITSQLHPRQQPTNSANSLAARPLRCSSGPFKPFQRSPVSPLQSTCVLDAPKVRRERLIETQKLCLMLTHSHSPVWDAVSRAGPSFVAISISLMRTCLTMFLLP